MAPVWSDNSIRRKESWLIQVSLALSTQLFALSLSSHYWLFIPAGTLLSGVLRNPIVEWSLKGEYIHIVDFTLLHISFVLFWDVIFLLGFSFSTWSNLDSDENPIGYTFIFLASLARQEHSKWFLTQAKKTMNLTIRFRKRQAQDKWCVLDFIHMYHLQNQLDSHISLNKVHQIYFCIFINLCICRFSHVL